MTGSFLTAVILLLLGLGALAQDRDFKPEDRGTDAECHLSEDEPDCCELPDKDRIDVANGTWKIINGLIFDRVNNIRPQIVYKCDKGYILVGDRLRNCTFDRRVTLTGVYWTGSKPECLPDPNVCLTRWTDWSKCDAECGGGFSYRNREVVRRQGPEAVFNPNCTSTTENRTCNPQKCRVCVLCDGVAVDHGTLTFLLKTEDLAPATDIIVVVDESSSMFRGHNWVTELVRLLDQDLMNHGVGATADRPNLFTLVGYGRLFFHDLDNQARLYPRRFLPVSGRPLFRSSEFASAASQLTSNGDHEDGYHAMAYAINNVTMNGQMTLRLNQPGIATNLIFISDEDRDIHPVARSFTRNVIKRLLRRYGIVPNVIVDHQFSANGGEQMVGVDYNNVAYTAGANGEVRNETRNVKLGHHYRYTKLDYSAMAMSKQLRGAAWDIKLMRDPATGALHRAFTKAFCAVKLKEIQSQARDCYECRCNADAQPRLEDCTRPREQRWCCLRAGGTYNESFSPPQCFAPSPPPTTSPPQ